jgi:NAD(P)-dependent dehydrogenase (short-subunit alcohol dehydrogenase family)
MKTVVITGSTRGIGYGMAHEFLQRGHQVMISGRSAESSEKAALALAIKHDAARIGHCACEVADYGQVQGLWDAAVKRFGRVDVLINNAGVTTYEEHFEKLPPDDIRMIVETNSIGMMYGSHVALRGMQTQGSGQIYNIEWHRGHGTPCPYPFIKNQIRQKTRESGPLFQTASSIMKFPLT